MKAIALSIGIALLAVPVQAMSITRDVVCYHFKNSTLKLRSICKLQEFDTSSSLTWSDGVKTRIQWVSRYSETPSLDGLPAREYKRDSETLRIEENPRNTKTVRCLQALKSNSSVCWSN
jgi:hypothetical protein